jgi:hypothetical protein
MEFAACIVKIEENFKHHSFAIFAKTTVIRFVILQLLLLQTLLSQQKHESAYIGNKTMEVIEVFYNMSSDYIKYLNDPNKNNMTYDQWKDKQARKKAEKDNSRNKNK